jgi:hypothetical protein
MVKEKENSREKIVDALEQLFMRGYTHLKMYKTGEVGLFFDANGYLIVEGDMAFHVSLQELLEGFVEDTSMAIEDVKTLGTKNPNGVRFGDYLLDVADELYENIEVK